MRGWDGCKDLRRDQGGNDGHSCTPRGGILRNGGCPHSSKESACRDVTGRANVEETKGQMAGLARKMERLDEDATDTVVAWLRCGGVGCRRRRLQPQQPCD